MLCSFYLVGMSGFPICSPARRSSNHFTSRSYSIMNLFQILTNKNAVLRKLGGQHDQICVKMTYPNRTPYTFSFLLSNDMYHMEKLKIRFLDLPPGERIIKRVNGHITLSYSFARWCPIVPSRFQLPFLNAEMIGQQFPLLRILDRKPGLADILREGSRIKVFRMKDAILHSYLYDMRFLTLIILQLGFALWWALVPEQFFLHPSVLTSPSFLQPSSDIRSLYDVIVDTFREKVCSSHPGENRPLPCQCGSPLNKSAEEIFAKPSFDPLQEIDKNARMKAIATYLARIVIVLTLSESISHRGVFLDIQYF